MKTRIISAFPGTGKTYCHNQHQSTLDSDSSKFDKKDFPANYIRHIKANIGSVKTIFVSSHKEVRDALIKEELDFIIVYPHYTLKEEYLGRYRSRGSLSVFVQLLDGNWTEWITEMVNQEGCQHIVLKSNQFISDIL